MSWRHKEELRGKDTDVPDACRTTKPAGTVVNVALTLLNDIMYEFPRADLDGVTCSV